MRRPLAIPLLFASTVLAGCSTVGNVFKKTGQILMDPSIQVGSAEDQPTQIALSLYAALDVNPNTGTDTPGQAPADGEPTATPPAMLGSRDGPYAVQFHSQTRQDLQQSLLDLLDYLEQDRSASPGGRPLQAKRGNPGTRPPLPANGGTPGRDDYPPLPLTASRDAAAGAMPDKAPLGQYREGASLSDNVDSSSSAKASAATPIAFRILQIKDDSLLENADPQLLRSDPKKALGSTYLSADDYVLAPGQFKFVNFTPIDEKAHYIAVVATFHDPNPVRWQDVFRLEPRGRKYPLLVTLQGTRVAIANESHRHEQDAQRPAAKEKTTP